MGKKKTGNLAEKSQVARYVYPKQMTNEIISQQQKVEFQETAMKRGKEQMEKGMKLNLTINEVRVSVLKGYGLVKERDALIARQYGYQKDNVKEQYRQLVHFANLSSDKIETQRKETIVVRAVMENDKLDVNVDILSMNTYTWGGGKKKKGLCVTFGSILLTLQDFVSSPPPNYSPLPRPSEELLNAQWGIHHDLMSSSSSSSSSIPSIEDEPEDIASILDQVDHNSELGIAEAAQKQKDAIVNLKMSVNIGRTVVQIVRYPNRLASMALLLTFEIKSTVEMHPETMLKVEAAIEAIQAYQAMLVINDEEKSISIRMREGVPKVVEPFSVKATISQYKSAIESNTTGNHFIVCSYQNL
ncbi:hypothetical protein RFI_00800 [Reticulomyxa filosa]|uniref:Uncharacterized protein n=1 Tax=Reticulomyxa filosa TaxID=46433 RepID=X6PF12_RETFI|nr:hypothetical protein RFI_00800 [Reticulomyxa filosa]|eukprot:ETO36267.1 hypothetical protein RFI_00800 [Reticulomyxa filosa]